MRADRPPFLGAGCHDHNGDTEGRAEESPCEGRTSLLGLAFARERFAIGMAALFGVESLEQRLWGLHPVTCPLPRRRPQNRVTITYAP